MSIGPERSAEGVSAVGDGGERAAHRMVTSGAESADALGEERAADGLEVVEGRHAIHAEPFLDAQRHLGRDASHRAGDGRHEKPGENRNGFATGDDKDGPALVLGLGPPDVALGRRHHGSSVIIWRVPESAHPTSASVCGILR